MSDDRPLHVRVAEALGCTIRAVFGIDEGVVSYWQCCCDERDHGFEHSDGYRSRNIVEYDTDWSATGPLIERYDILLAQTSANWMACTGFGGSHGDDWIDDVIYDPSYGETPLVAICNLILALKAAGKL